jgi:membrane-bound lytic murein transglycosylase F
LWFALASYNAGYGHVVDARRIASEMGRNPDRWFTGVAPVMPLLARPEYHRNARYGYCRCQEPVRYVRKIRETYQAYREATEAGDGSG